MNQIDDTTSSLVEGQASAQSHYDFCQISKRLKRFGTPIASNPQSPRPETRERRWIKTRNNQDNLGKDEEQFVQEKPVIPDKTAYLTHQSPRKTQKTRNLRYGKNRPTSENAQKQVLFRNGRPKMKNRKPQKRRK